MLNHLVSMQRSIGSSPTALMSSHPEELVSVISFFQSLPRSHDNSYRATTQTTLVNWKLCLLAQLPLQHNGPVQHPHYCWRHTNRPVRLLPSLVNNTPRYLNSFALGSNYVTSFKFIHVIFMMLQKPLIGPVAHCLDEQQSTTEPACVWTVKWIVKGTSSSTPGIESKLWVNAKTWVNLMPNSPLALHFSGKISHMRPAG